MKRNSTLLSAVAMILILLVGFTRAATTQAAPLAATTAGPTLPNPILFVTQMPFPSDFTTINAVFGNHKGSMQDAPRGGDLWIRYPDGTLKNLTAAAGYGSSGLQGANAIAVRDPAVYWDGTKALFSMLIGAPTQQYQVKTYYWQLYEITGLGQNQTPVITKVPNQPANYNNVSPIYGTDDRIIFTTDRARNGAAHLSPQRDEYEEAPVVSGVWSLDPKTGDLKLLNHAPSGDFTPIVDSFGRVIFTQWDHLQRDQQADADANFGTGKNCASSWYGTGNYTDESAASPFNPNNRAEVFPEPRSCRGDLLAGTNLAGHEFNHFTPWQMTEDGTDLETINHLGRHELNSYIPASLTDDPNLVYSGLVTRFNPNTIENMLEVREAANTPGLYYGINAPEFGTHAAGQVVSISAPPNANPDHTLVNYVTHKETASTSNNPTANHSGLYRDPLPLADGTVVVAHTSATQQDRNVGTTAQPASLYAFRLQLLTTGSNGFQIGGAFLTTGISKTISYWDPDTKVNYSGLLWELQPVEVRARPRPQRFAPAMPQPAQQVFTQVGVDPVQFKNYLAQNNLALIVSQNVTTRDDADKEQPFNLRVPGGVQTLGAGGKIYDVARLQIFQGDQIRGLSGCCSNTPFPGRRVLAQPLHEPAALAANLANTGSPTDSVTIAADGSVAAFVPARRAMSWQLTAPNGTPVVRERVWVTFQPGEVRVCGSCHGVNEFDQAGHTLPTNQPQALLKLLQAWKANNSGNPTPTATAMTTATPTLTPITTQTPTPTVNATATPVPPTAPPTATATKPPATATTIAPTPTPTATKPANVTPTTPATPSSAPSQIAGCNVFPANNIWNARVDTLPLDPSSATYVNTIGAGTGLHPDFGQGLWNGGPIGIPFVVVPGTQPKVTVTFQYADESDAGPYPIPTNAPIEGGQNSSGDRHVLVLDKDNCLLYETWSSYPQANGSWQTGSGARFDLKANALRPATWTSADAAGLPILPGLVRYDEVASGEIKHAIRFTVPQTRKAFIWPARHFASSLTGAQYPPMGQRFRLRANFDVNSTAYNFAPEVKVILRAMQKYGIILADNGSAWYISGAPDERWNNDNLSKLGLVKGADFEAVNEAGLMVDPNSGQVGNGGPTPIATPLATATGIVTATPTKMPTATPMTTPTPTPMTTPTPTATPATGISGKVTADGTGIALADIWVHLLRQGNTGWQVTNATKTEASGNYKFVNLTAGIYRVSFFDPRLTYKAELYDNATKIDLAKDVAVTGGVMTANINASLALATAPLAQVRGSVAYANNPNTGQLTLLAWPESQFTFQRTITCGDGAKASDAQLLVGGQSFPMSATTSDGALYAVTLGTQGNFTAGQVYSLQTRWTCTAVTASSEETPANALSEAVGELHTLAQMPTNRVFDEQTGQSIAGARVYLYQAPDWRPRTAPEDSVDATCESAASKPADAGWSQSAPADIGTLVDDSLSSAAATQIDPLANPQWTGDDGHFAWNAPSGCWYVRVEADGYATTYSPVTGVTTLTDLNIALTPLRYLYLPVVASN